MNTAQKILKNVGSLTFANVASKILSLAVVIYLARVLQPAGFGKLNFALVIMTVFVSATTFGFDVLGAREVAKNKENLKNYVVSFTSLRLFFTITGFILLMVLVELIIKQSEVKQLALIYGLSLFAEALVLDWVFQGLERMEYVGIYLFGRQLLYCALIFFLVNSPGQLLLVPWLYLLAGLVGASFLLILFLRNYGSISLLSFDFAFWKYSLRETIPVGIGGLLTSVIFYFNTVFIGLFRDYSEVGYFNAAYKIVMMLLTFTGVYYKAVFPVFSKYFKLGFEQHLQRFIFYNGKLTTLLAVPLAIFGTFLAQPLMNSMYATGYEKGVIVLQILIWFVAINTFSAMFANGLIAAGHQNKYMEVVAMQTGGTLVLNLVLIPPLGIIGASIALLFPEVVAVYFYHRYFKRLTGYDVTKYIGKTVVAAFGAGLLLLGGIMVFKFNPILIAAPIGVAYVVFLIMVGELNREDISRVRSLLPRRIE